MDKFKHTFQIHHNGSRVIVIDGNIFTQLHEAISYCRNILGIDEDKIKVSLDNIFSVKTFGEFRRMMYIATNKTMSADQLDALLELSCNNEGRIVDGKVPYTS